VDEPDEEGGSGLTSGSSAGAAGGAGAGGGKTGEGAAPGKTKSVVVRTTNRQTVFLPMPGLVPVEELKPNDLVGCNKDSFLILSKLPVEYDSRVKAMELDEKPNEEYSDVGGADKQIQELKEAIVLPMTHGHLFKALGVRPPKGVLLHGREWNLLWGWGLPRSRCIPCACACAAPSPSACSAGHGQDAAGACVRQVHQRRLPEACRPVPGADVHRRRRQDDPGRV